MNNLNQNPFEGKNPIFLHRLKKEEGLIREVDTKNIHERKLKKEELENLSIRTDKIVQKFIELDVSEGKKTEAKTNKLSHKQSRYESFSKVRLPEATANNEMVRLLFQNKSTIFKDKLRNELKRSIMKIKGNDAYEISQKIDKEFRGAESVVSAIHELMSQKRVSDYGIREHFIGTNDMLDATEGIDCIEIYEDVNKNIIMNLIQVKSSSQDETTNEQYVEKHRKYINSLPNFKELFVKNLFEKELSGIFQKKYADLIKEDSYDTYVHKKIQEIITFAELVEEDSKEKNSAFTKDFLEKNKKDVSIDEKIMSVLIPGSTALFNLKQNYAFSDYVEQKIIEVAQWSKFPQDEIMDMYLQKKEKVTFFENIKINSIVMTKGDIEKQEDISNPNVQLVMA